MQAISIAIGKAGVNFFTKQLVAKELIKTLSTMKAPDREIKIDRIEESINSASDIDIKLTQGALNNFTPVFQSVSQQPEGKFSLQLGDDNFSAQYNWYESYQYTKCYPSMGLCDPPVPRSGSFGYAPSFSNLTVTIPLKFQYDSARQEWDVVALASTANPPAAQPNIPSGSITQRAMAGCFTSHVSDATAAAVSSIDFSAPISQLIQGIVASIPGSGNLGNDIVYDFSLGSSGLLFPGNDGIQMGVKGGASYKGTAFSGPAQPTLPLPAPLADSDTHHLNMYVSNYEVDALHWAYYKAGQLNLNVTPQDLPDPSVLNVSKYTTLEPTLVPYSAFVMNAEITQNSAPVTSFQTAYVFSKTVMASLQTKLPANVYNLIEALPSNAFLTKASLDAFLTNATVPAQYFTVIENAGMTMAMVLTQDIKFVMTIRNNQTSLPHIDFIVKRKDVLTNLGLGMSKNNTQTMQFGFANAENTVKYIGSSIAGFNGTIFEQFTWTVLAEGNYAETLIALGKIGVPLPIMKDFQFDFTNAQLSVQEGYVSILANVLYK